MQRNPSAPGFIDEEVLITSLTSKVKDAKVILERFFDITRIGFNFNNGTKSPTCVSPKKLSKDMVAAIESIIHEVRFFPGEEPKSKNLVKSQVTVQKNITSAVRKRLAEECREDLLPAVNWILDQESPLTFYYMPAGSLLARDKSVWPIKSIEMWPGWLRAMLFGTVIDIENAYCQFIISKLEVKYTKNPNRFKMMYPDLIRADKEKQAFREEICECLKLEINDDNISVVKKLIMSLANGSNITPALLASGSTRSEAVRIVREASPHLLASDFVTIGNRLQRITKQFRGAKRDLCMHLLHARPTKENQKKIFKLYFEWERAARYKIWEATGFTGLSLHDGLDGIVINNPSKLIADLHEKHGLRTAIKYDKCCEST